MRQPTIQPRCVRSISIGGAGASLRDSEELGRLDALERVVRAGVHAGRLVVLPAQVAGGGLLAHHRLLPARLLGILALHQKGVEVDVAVWALGGAQSTADAPVLDDDLERVRMAADRAD